MIQKQQEYVELITQAIDALSLEHVELTTEKLEIVKKSLEEQELLVPIIGEFSSGKSTLLNSFLGTKILPTNITPETSIATELRYGVDERIDAIYDGNVVKTYELSEFDKIKEHAADYSYVKVYLNNDKLRSIEPLILVDMPGFESNIESHNKSISIYLNRGSYFCCLINAEERTIRRSAFRRFNEIMECDRDFSLVISKENLVSKESLQTITEHIADEIYNHLDVKKQILTVGKDGIEAFNNIIESLDPNKLFMQITQPLVKTVLYESKASINTKLSSLENTEEYNMRAIDELKNALESIESKRDKLLRDATSNEKITSKVTKIVNALDQEFQNSIDSLVRITKREGVDGLTKEISDIFSATVVPLVNSSVKEMAISIDASMIDEIKDVKSILSSFTNDEFISTSSSMMKELLTDFKTSLNTSVEKRKEKKDGSGLYNVITSLLAITTNFINPVLEVAIVFLPQILKGFTKSLEEKAQQERERQQTESIRTALLTEIIPKVKRGVRTEVESIFREQSEELVRQITNQYESILQAKHDEINAAEQERKAHIDELNNRIEAIRNAKHRIENAYNIACKG